MHNNIPNKTLFYDKLAAQKKWDEFANEYETTRRLKIIFDDFIVVSELRNKLFLDADIAHFF